MLNKIWINDICIKTLSGEQHLYPWNNRQTERQNREQRRADNIKQQMDGGRALCRFRRTDERNQGRNTGANILPVNNENRGV